MRNCNCADREIIACVKIKISGDLMLRRDFDGSSDNLCKIEAGDIVQIVRRV